MSVSVSSVVSSVSVSVSVHWVAWHVLQAGSASDEQVGAALGVGSVHRVGVDYGVVSSVTVSSMTVSSVVRAAVSMALFAIIVSVSSWLSVGIGHGSGGQSEECQDDELVHGAGCWMIDYEHFTLNAKIVHCLLSLLSISEPGGAILCVRP